MVKQINHIRELSLFIALGWGNLGAGHELKLGPVGDQNIISSMRPLLFCWFFFFWGGGSHKIKCQNFLGDMG